MKDRASLYLRLNGIPTESVEGIDETSFAFDGMWSWRPSKGDSLYKVEDVCVRLHDDVASKIFGTLGTYYRLLPQIPEFMFTAGMNSESNMPRQAFETIVNSNSSDITFNKLLYLYDCRKLISGIQECNKEVVILLGEFYRGFNLDPLFSAEVEEPDGVRFVSSPTTTKILSHLSFIFIRLYSLLDYTTKLVVELEKLRSVFDRYPKLASANFLYGDRDKVSFCGQPDTLFENCDLIREIDIYRNLLVHDGLLDDMPKIYKVVRDGRTIEKFILMPDRGVEGRFEKFKNRGLFYSREDKINLRLPSMIEEFQLRQHRTMEVAREKFVADKNAT